MRNFSWTPSEDEILRDMKAQGKTSEQIGIVLRRGLKSVRHRWQYLNETPETKLRRLQYNKDHRKKTREIEKAERLAAPDYRIPPAEGIIVPDHVLDERNERLSRAPTSICELLLGDPHPARSALGQKGALQ